MPTALHRFYRITLRHGYMDVVITRDLVKLLYDQLRVFVVREQIAELREPPSVTVQTPQILHRACYLSLQTPHPGPGWFSPRTFRCRDLMLPIRTSTGCILLVNNRYASVKTMDCRVGPDVPRRRRSSGCDKTQGAG